jgi:hypothetical protein
MRFSAVSAIIPGHLTKPKNLHHARVYCEKEGDFWIIDNRKQGRRTDLEEVSNAIKEGATVHDVARDYSCVFIKYHAGLTRLVDLCRDNSPRSFKPTVHWFWGSTGTGKTRSVFEMEEDVWVSGEDSRFFNNYKNQEAALLDDFRGDFCKFHILLQLLDRYPFTVNIKFGCAQWNSKRIYVTSSKSPEEVYNKNEEDINQLLRRIDNIVEFRKLGEKTVVNVIKGEFKGVITW